MRGIYPWTKTTTCESWMRTILKISCEWLFLLHPRWNFNELPLSRSCQNPWNLCKIACPLPPLLFRFFMNNSGCLKYEDMISLLVRCQFPPLWEFNHAHSLSLSQRILKRSVHVYTHLVQHFDKEYPFCLLHPIFLWKFQWRTEGTKTQKYFFVDDVSFFLVLLESL